MLLSLFFATLGFSACNALAELTHVTRDTQSLGQFYAYGTNISGAPLFYSGGRAYVGWRAPSNNSVHNVTLTLHGKGKLKPSPTNSTKHFDWESSLLYIDTTSGAFKEAGFTASNTTSDTAVTTSGFSTFGTLLVWTADDGEIKSQWYAEKVDTAIWALKWNEDNTVTDDVAVVLKNLAPSH